MGPSASAELACYGVDGRSPLLMVPAPPNAKTCGFRTKGIIQRLEAEHWHLCFRDYLKLEIFRGQQPPQPLCSFCWHPLGRTATTGTVLLKPGDPWTPRTDSYCVQENSKSCTFETTSGVKCIYCKHPNHTEATFKSYNIFNQNTMNPSSALYIFSFLTQQITKIFMHTFSFIVFLFLLAWIWGAGKSNMQTQKYLLYLDVWL